MDPRMYPQGAEIIDAADVETTVTAADLLETFNSDRGGERKALSILTLLGSAPITRHVETEYTVARAISADVSCVAINNATPATGITLTIAAPAAGRFLVIYQKDSGTAGNIVNLTAGTYDGTNNEATFNAQNECLVLYGISATRFVVVENIGSVALATHA